MHTTEQWGLFEIILTGPQTGNPFLDVELQATFRHKHRHITVDGFYDGQDVYKIRFMPDMPGEWTYTTTSNVGELDGQHGQLTCIEPSERNHGPVRIELPRKKYLAVRIERTA